MGRPRGGGKANKQPTSSQVTKSEDADAGTGSAGEEEAAMPAYKRRGRPLKHRHHHSADDTDDEDDGGAKAEPMEDAKPVAPVMVVSPDPENGNGGRKRRRRPRQTKRGCDSAAEDKDEAVKQQSGFRHHASRRKSTPRRAAEAGVECK